MRLFHRDLGGDGQPPLVILHGFLGSSRNWQTAGAALSSRFHVYALDLRNHGRSPHAPEMTYPVLVDDVVAWMDAQGLAQTTLLGHSMGGKVAMRVACAQARRVERLIVVDIAPKQYPGGAQRSELAAMNELQLVDLHSRAEAEMRLEARVADWAMRKFLTMNLEQGADGRWQWIVDLPVLTEAVTVLLKSPLGPGNSFDGPADFILSSKSGFVQPEDHAVIRGHFPSARFMVLANAGHNPHMEMREEFVRRVLEIA